MYLVTGGAGFIGSNIVRALVEKGYPVRVLDNFCAGRRENVMDFIDRIELVVCDLRELDAVREAVEGVEYIFHHGALSSVAESIADPIGTNESNVTGTLNVLAAAREMGVKRLVYAGSSSVYGDGVELPKHEQLTPHPKSPYALQKLTAEYYCRQYTELYGLSTVVLRYFNVFGPWQDPEGNYAAAIPKFIQAALDGRKPVIFGDGEQTRDFIFVKDVVSANLRAMEVPDANGKIFNVASGKSFSLNNLIKKLGTVLDKKIVAQYEPERDGDIKHSVADVTKAEKILGFKPQYSLEDGLRSFVDWYKSHVR